MKRRKTRPGYGDRALLTLPIGHKARRWKARNIAVETLDELMRLPHWTVRRRLTRIVKLLEG